jgi:hypothetical protein
VTRIGSYTPLHIAGKAGSAAVVRELLKAGADVNAVTTNGAAPLHFAAQSGDPDAVGAMLDKGANANARETEWGQTPLVFAAEYDRPAAIKVLLKRGADPSIHTTVMNLTEETAREQAATRKRNEVLISFMPKERRDSIAKGHGCCSSSGTAGRHHAAQWIRRRPAARRTRWTGAEGSVYRRPNPGGDRLRASRPE